MSSIAVGTIGIFVLLIAFALGIPVSISMALVGVIGVIYLTSFDAGIGLIALEFSDTFTSYDLTVIPTFVLMGTIAFAAGIGSRLFDLGNTVFGRMRGGLAISTIVSSAGFSAVCGATTAGAATMGKVALPEMRKLNYDDSLATGCIAAGGTLSVLIPPSSVLPIYAILTQQSIGKMLIAGIIPGILQTLLFVGVVIFVCYRNPSLAPAGKVTSIATKLAKLFGVLEMVMLFLLVMGGIFIGWFTPSQAGAVGATGTLLVALIRRKIGWPGVFEALKDAALISCMAIMIVAGAMIFGRFMTLSEVTLVLVDWVTQLPLSPMAIMGIIILFHILGGCVMDAFAMCVLSIPIVFPVVKALGYDPIWYGVLMVVVSEAGAITPPVGINTYIIKGLAPDIPIGTVFRGAFPFVLALFVLVVLMVLFPEIVLFLPSFVS